MKNMIIIRKNCSYKNFLNFSLNVGVFKTAFVYRHLVAVYGIQFQPETIIYIIILVIMLFLRTLNYLTYSKSIIRAVEKEGSTGAVCFFFRPCKNSLRGID